MNSNLFAFQSRKLNSSTTWLLFIFLGWSYGSMGKMGKQILYWFTLGGFGLWFLYVLVNLGDRIKQYNYELAMELGLTDEEMKMMGVCLIKQESKKSILSDKWLSVSIYVRNHLEKII